MEKFCTHCGGPLAAVAKDGRERLVCTACHRTIYRNAKIIAGTVPMQGDQVLLCRRAIEPQCGLWTLPSGYLETEETTIEGAIRETREEAGVEVAVKTLFTLIDLPHLSQVHLYYLAEITDTRGQPGPESSEVQLFPLNDIPWDEIAFGTVRETLKRLAEAWPRPAPHHLEVHASSHTQINQLIEHPLCAGKT